jgi:hypothetical protein
MALTNTNPGTNKKRSRIKTSGLVAIALIKLATINYLRRARSVVAGIERATPNLLSLFHSWNKYRRGKGTTLISIGVLIANVHE